MDTEINAAILGIIGTLLGTIVGWLLNNISNSGRLNLYVANWKDEFKYNSMGSMVPSHSFEQTEYYSYTLDLELYNSSSRTKIMRNIKILFLNGNTPLKAAIPHDNDTGIRHEYFSTYSDVGPINIPPKTILTKKLHNGFWSQDDLSFIKNANSIIMQYADERDRIKKIKIKSENYIEYFTTIHQEDNSNDR